MISDERINASVDFVEWLRATVHNQPLPTKDKVRAAGACFAIAQEHHDAIVQLIALQRYASSFALVRVAFEAYVRGLWLSLCANDAQARRFLGGWEPPEINVLLEEVEQTSGFSEKVLSRIKRRSWKAMCAYTHTGGLHAQRWTSIDAIESNYTVPEIEDVIAHAELIGAMSVLGIADLAGNVTLSIQVLERVKARVQR